MIRKVEMNELGFVANYAYQLNINPQHRCKAFPTDYDSIIRQFERMINHPNDELLVSTDGNDICGVLALLVEPEDMYIEATGGVFAKNNYEKVSNDFFKYIKSKYKGYQFDAAYPEDNKEAIDFMSSIGAELKGFDYELRLKKSEYKNHPIIDNILPLDKQHYGEFIKIHDKYNPDVYWSGEKLLDALDRFDIFIALDNGQVIGSVVTSKFAKNFEEIYFLEVAENKQNHGYGSSLLNKAIQHAFYNGTDELMVMVEKNNTAALHLYEKLKFKKSDTCLTYSIKIH